MTVSDLVIADLVDECDRLRRELAIAREMLIVAVEQQHETLRTLDRLRRERVQRAGSVMLR